MYQKIITAAALLICTYTDLQSRTVNKLTVAGYFLLAAAGKTLQFLSGHDIAVQDMTAGFLVGIVCLIVSFATQQGFGYGDSILILVFGLSVGGKECFPVVLTALFWAGMWGLIRWRIRKQDLKEEIPFVPFLLGGFVMHNMMSVLT